MGVSNGALLRVGRTVEPTPFAKVARLVVPAALLCLLVGSTGCQSKPIQTHRLIESYAIYDFRDLNPAETQPETKAYGATPTGWEKLPPQKTALYTYRQWRSPSTNTGVGVAYIRLPLPISAKAVLWLARREYTKKANDGKLVGEWVDDVGRSWFEAENDKYHVRGYCLAQGFEAWVVYFGYKVNAPPNPGEISQAARSADTFIPLVGGVTPPVSPSTVPTTAPSTSPSAAPAAAGTQPAAGGK